MQARNLFDLCGRVALITGASTQGIGSEAAKFLAENHANHPFGRSASAQIGMKRN